MSKMDETARARYRVLLESLREEASSTGVRGGWQDRVATQLGISQGLVSKIARMDREPGLTTIGKAIDRMNLRREFFYDPALGDAPDYRDFIGAAEDSRVEREDHTAWLEVVADGYVDEARAQGVEEEVIQSIRRVDLRGGVTAEYLRQRLDVEMGRIRRDRARTRRPELPQAREARLKREAEREGGGQ